MLELALLAPDTAGRNLADMGAEVIKIEGPPRGDYIRDIGSVTIGGPRGTSLAHLNWNRGKKSVCLDLKNTRGREVFLELVKKSDVVIDGLRAGVLDRLGVGFDDVRSVNGAIVYCALSGLGRSGPYTRLATHGTFYDAYVGLRPPQQAADGSPRMPPSNDSVGIEAGGLFATVAILSALVSARATGVGSLVEVAEADAATAFVSTQLESALNDVSSRDIVGGGLAESVRYNYYLTLDDRVMLLQALEAKFWENFCTAVERPDLLEKFPSRGTADHAAGNEELRAALQAIFKTKTQDTWVDLFLARNIPGGPVHVAATLVDDRHFRARDLVYDLQTNDFGTLHLLGSPVKVSGQTFQSELAPAMGQSTDSVLRDLLGIDRTELAALRAAGAVQ